MAVVKLGSLITDIRGSLGGHNFSRNKSGLILSTSRKPLGQKTIYQSSINAYFLTVSQLWATLTKNQRKSWSDAALTYKIKDRFGLPRTRSGYWLYINFNINLLISGQPVITDFVLQGEFPYLTNFDTLFDAATSQMDIGMDSNALTGQVLIFATPPLSQGIIKFKYYFKLIKIVAPGNEVNIPIWSEYVARFRTPALNDNIWYYLKWVSPNGHVVFSGYINFFDNL